MGDDFDLDPEEDLYKILTCRDPKIISDDYDGLESIAQGLRTDLQNGLSGDEQDLAARREKYGANVCNLPPTPSLLERFFDAFGDTALIILTTAAGVALLAGILEAVLTEEKNGWIEGVAIIVAVLVVASVASINDYNKDLQFQRLKKKTGAEKTCFVLRDGKESSLLLSEVCVGDVIALKAGQQIPCDGLYIPLPGLEGSAADVLVSEAAMTGEPLPRRKNIHEPVMWSGTTVQQGNGHMLVLAVGSRSEWGKLIENMQEEEETTPLQEKLEDIVVFIGKIGVAVAIAVFVVLIIYWFIDYVADPKEDRTCTDNEDLLNMTNPFNNTCTSAGIENPGSNTSLIEYQASTAWNPFSLIEALKDLIIAITIVVVAVPEGLPLAVTISLAYSMELMSREGNLVRHLKACETMGGATNICSDKTGTLTENRMKVVKGWVAGKTFDDPTEVSPSKQTKQLLLDSLVLNLEHANLVFNQKTEKMEFAGLPTECCLLVFAETVSGSKYSELQKGVTTVHRWNFTSARKKMSTVVRTKDGDAKYRLYCKGAAERVLGQSINVVTKDGGITKLDEKTRKKLNIFIEKMAKLGLRTLSLGYRDFSSKEMWAESDDGVGYEEDLTLIGVVAIEDPIRKEVPEAVFLCRVAGIKVRMVTGDNLLTASKIAKECGILQKGDIVLEGPNFAKLSDDDLDAILPKLAVLARSQPVDKHRLVTRLIQNQEIVAVTGDGTNDAPALAAASVGLAMGSGTEVAQEAADIIILGDNFATIVTAVKWGRCVFDNIRKFIQFQLTVNVVALVVAFIGAISRFGTPLTAIQLLWVNLIMDSFAALALGTERPRQELLYRKPYGRESKIVTPIMWRNIIGQSVVQVIVTFLILYALDFSKDYPQPHLFLPTVESAQFAHAPSAQYTTVFNTFVWMQIGNEINSRKLTNHKNVFEGITTNYLFIGVIIFTAAVQVLLVFVGGLAFNLTPVSWELWLFAIAGGFLMLITGFLLRLIPVPLEDWEVERDPEVIKRGLQSNNEEEDETKEKESED